MTRWNSLLHQKHPGRAEHEHHQRVSVKSIAKPSPPRARLVFVDGQCRQRTEPAFVEISTVGMMDGVIALPDGIGRHGQHPERAPNPVVRRALLEEGAMTAIVLDQEQSDEKQARRDCEQQSQDIAHVERQPRQHP